jgi:hypothetical protein
LRIPFKTYLQAHGLMPSFEPLAFLSFKVLCNAVCMMSAASGGMRMLARLLDPACCAAGDVACGFS